MTLKKSALLGSALALAALGLAEPGMAISDNMKTRLAAKNLMQIKGRVHNTGTYNVSVSAKGFPKQVKPDFIRKFNVKVANTAPYVVVFDIDDGANGCQFTFNTDDTIVPLAIDPVDAITVSCTVAADGTLQVSGV